MSKRQKHFTKRLGTFRVLYYWGKILGINPLTLSESNQLKFSYLSLLLACFFGLFSCCMLYFYLSERWKMLLPDEAPITIIVDYAEISHVLVNTLLTWLTYGFCQHQIKLIVESFGNAEKNSRTLGIMEDYERHFVKLGIRLTVVNIVFLFASVIIVVRLSLSPTYNWLLWMGYYMLRLPPINSLVVFLWSIDIVKSKLHRLHEKMRLLMLCHRDNFHLPEENVYIGLFRNFSSKQITLLDVIRTITEQRRELIELIESIKGYFQLILLMDILTEIPVALVNGHIAYATIKASEPGMIDMMYVIVHAAWVILPVLTLMDISNTCGSTVKEANNTGNVLHETLNSYGNLSDSQEVMNINMFSFEVLQNRVSISLFGLIDLDYFMVYKVIAIGTAYFVIMLQF